jgi:hypothetical protein
VTDSNENQEVFVCASSSAEPVVIDNPGPAIEVDVGDFHIRGVRLGFEIDDDGEGAADTTNIVLGWIDLQTGEVALDPLNPGTHSLLPDYLISYAFAPNGTPARAAKSSRSCRYERNPSPTSTASDPRWSSSPPTTGASSTGRSRSPQPQ